MFDPLVYTSGRIRDHGVMDPLAAIAALPPTVAEDLVATAVAKQFGLEGSYLPLVSERDQNFRLTTADGRRFVVKVTSSREDRQSSDLQLGALLHLEGKGVSTPTVVRTLDGKAFARVDAGERGHRLRVVTWIDGETLRSTGIDADHAARLGAALARLDRALQDYVHPGDNPILLWDLQRVAELRPLVTHIDELPLRQRVVKVLDDVGVTVANAGLPRQVIHGDANPENILVTGDEIGFIDFGDMLRAPRIFDVAIAASYLRNDGDDVLEYLRPFVAAYHTTAPLGAAEAERLFDLVRARLATTITLLYWRLRERSPDDAYRRKSLETERTASHFLAALDGIGREYFNRQINELLT
jgi:Ser/Thr protein kinase RdoA (MazF antagonist)